MNLFLKIQNNSTLTTSSMSPQWHTVTNQPFYWWSQAAWPPQCLSCGFSATYMNHQLPGTPQAPGIQGCQAREELYQLKNPTNRQGVLSLQVNFISAKADTLTLHLLARHRIALFSFSGQISLNPLLTCQEPASILFYSSFYALQHGGTPKCCWTGNKIDMWKSVYKSKSVYLI